LGGIGGLGGAGGAAAGQSGSYGSGASGKAGQSGVAGANGGAGVGGASGHNGSFVLGNNVLLPTSISVLGAGVTPTTGAQGANPFINSGAKTPYIPNLTGGAELYGVLGNVSAQDAFFQPFSSAAPKGAIAALIRVQTGPGVFDLGFTGFDNLLFVNLTGSALSVPELGISETGPDGCLLNPLMTGGFATDPLFGGDGPADLGSLAGFDVWDTLIPDSGTLFNFAGDGYSLTNVALEDGDAAYLVPTQGGPSTVPEPTTLGLVLAGLLGLGVIRRRRPSDRSR
jgi:hypothetical protein